MQLSVNARRTDSPEGTVILDATRGIYWQLNSSGARVLDLLLAGESSGDIAQRLVQEMDALESDIHQDVDELVAKLLNAKLLVP